MATQLGIIDGDPKELLMPQLGDIGRVSPRPAFKLTLWTPDDWTPNDPQVEVFINGLVAEDGSGTDWMLLGNIAKDDVRMYPWLKPFSKFKAVYDTRHRKGFLSPDTD